MKKISAVLAGATFTRWRTAGRRLAALSDAVAAALGEQGMDAGQCRVKRWHDGELLLQAASAAAAARIRQILPSLRRALNNAGFPVAEIRVSHLSR